MTQLSASNPRGVRMAEATANRRRMESLDDQGRPFCRMVSVHAELLACEDSKADRTTGQKGNRYSQHVPPTSPMSVPNRWLTIGARHCGGGAYETLARGRHIRRRRQAQKRPNKQSLFPLRHSLRGAGRLVIGEWIAWICLRATRTRRLARHTSPHSSRLRNLSKVRSRHLDRGR